MSWYSEALSPADFPVYISSIHSLAHFPVSVKLPQLIELRPDSCEFGAKRAGRFPHGDPAADDIRSCAVRQVFRFLFALRFYAFLYAPPVRPVPPTFGERG